MLVLGPTGRIVPSGGRRASRAPCLQSAQLEVTVTRNRNRSETPRIKVHWTRNPIPEEDTTTIEGIPVTKPARTLLDLAEVEPVEVVERCLEDALRRGLVSLALIDSWPRIRKEDVILGRRRCSASWMPA